MIDLHTHILPAVDDGAADLQTAVAMGRYAEEHGIEVICATPHFYGSVTWAGVQQRVEDLRRHFAQEGLKVELVPGAELLMDSSLLQLQREEVPTYGGQGKFCLIELPMSQVPVYTDQVFFALQTMGITPIVAHPERYRAVGDDPNTVLSWLEHGCLIQVNTGSILGRFGAGAAETARILLTHDMAHFVASDAHSLHRRPPDLPAAHEVLVEMVGAERAKELVEDNPRAVLGGGFAPRRAPRAYTRKRRFFLFRR